MCKLCAVFKMILKIYVFFFFFVPFICAYVIKCYVIYEIYCLVFSRMIIDYCHWSILCFSSDLSPLKFFAAPELLCCSAFHFNLSNCLEDLCFALAQVLGFA